MTTEAEDDQPTFGCRICGRRFVKSSLEKHEPACKKLTKMQRKVFDSGKQRAQNSDIPLKDVRKAAMERDKIGGVFPRPQTHWRERHEEFMGVVNSSKQVGQALKTGAPLPPPPKTAMNPDYIRCEFCGRSFNKNAAERHIEFCKEQSLRKGTMAGKRQNSSTSNSSRQKTASSTASSIRNGNLSATSTKTPSSSSSSRGSRPGSAGPRRPSNGILNNQQQPIQMMIGGAAVGGGGLATKLPQPTTKRSNSAPRGNNQQQTMQIKSSNGNKSNFATPKSAGNVPGATMNKGEGGKMVKSNSKQKL